MDISLFDYILPRELIAQFPARRRDQSHLMVFDRLSGSTQIFPFKRIIEYINPSDALVVNNTKVFKARLFGRRATGAKVEIFLIRQVRTRCQVGSPDDTWSKAGAACRWEAFVSPARRVKEGEYICFENIKVLLEQDIGGGKWLVRFQSLSQQKQIIRQFGHIPLPHYIKRDDQPEDLRRYQTVFASKEKIGAVAAPTAGFHFTRSILDNLWQKGVPVIEITLHVGPGTFKPVTADDIDDHLVDPEFAELSQSAADKINLVRKKGGKIFAVGTTSVRTLESAQIVNGEIQPFSAMVDLYIKPGYRFKIVDHLVTNFHLPKSSLLILVSAFAGRERILDAYQQAIQQQMRFYSYGDAMLIL